MGPIEASAEDALNGKAMQSSGKKGKLQIKTTAERWGNCKK